jgi:hypothetical protein
VVKAMVVESTAPTIGLLTGLTAVETH